MREVGVGLRGESQAYSKYPSQLYGKQQAVESLSGISMKHHILQVKFQENLSFLKATFLRALLRLHLN